MSTPRGFSAWQIIEGGQPTFMVGCSEPVDCHLYSGKTHNLETPAALLSGIGVNIAFAPSSNFGTQILNRGRFTHSSVFNGVHFHFAPESPGEGMVDLRIGEAGIYTAMGCPMIVATLAGNLAWAHAGRDCLFDRGFIDTQVSSRAHPSVVSRLLNSLDPLAKNRDDVRVWVFYSIKPTDFSHDFNHPQHGPFNKRFLDYLGTRGYPESTAFTSGCWHTSPEGLHLDLPKIIEVQCRDQGVKPGNMHLGAYSYLLDTLPTTKKPGDDPNKRNYIVVVTRLL